MNLELLTKVRDRIRDTNTLYMHAWIGLDVDIDESRSRTTYHPNDEIATAASLAAHQANATIDDDTVPIGSCGTTACIAGWAATVVIDEVLDSLPDYDHMMTWIRDELPMQFPTTTGWSLSVEEMATAALDITRSQARRLFYTGHGTIWNELIPPTNVTYYDNPSGYDPTVEEAVMVLDTIIANPSIL